MNDFNKSTTIQIEKEAQIEEIKPIIAQWIKDSNKIKKIECHMEVIDVTPPEAKWKEYKPGRRRLIISE